jgi:nuclear receptor subfamily 1 group D member 3
MQDDQLILIKAGFFEVWLTRMARLFDQTRQTVLFSDGGIVQRSELEIIFTVR